MPSADLRGAVRGWAAGLLLWFVLGSLALGGFTSAALARESAATGGAAAAAGASIAVAELPPEARTTLTLIRAGGPFPYDKDGTVFGNREGLLPRQSRGYYTEYTVRTPGSRDRGARRIVAGGDPRRSGEYWYTGDHYRSFQRIRE
jgi:ribonuclease T1